MEKEQDCRPQRALTTNAAVLIGLIAAFLSLLLTPSIFSNHLAMSFLLHREVVGLWILFGLTLAASASVIVARSTVRFEVLSLFFSILILMGVELAACMAVVALVPETKKEPLERPPQPIRTCGVPEVIPSCRSRAIRLRP